MGAQRSLQCTIRAKSGIREHCLPLLFFQLSSAAGLIVQRKVQCSFFRAPPCWRGPDIRRREFAEGRRTAEHCDEKITFLYSDMQQQQQQQQSYPQF